MGGESVQLFHLHSLDQPGQRVGCAVRRAVPELPLAVGTPAEDSSSFQHRQRVLITGRHPQDTRPQRTHPVHRNGLLG